MYALSVCFAYVFCCIAVSKASEVQASAESMTLTYAENPTDISAMASLGAYGMSPQNCDHELLKMFGKEVNAPRPVSLSLPVLRKTDNAWVSTHEEIDVFAAHDWIACLANNGLLDRVFGTMDQIEEFWSEVRDDDPKFHRNPICTVGGWQKLFYPIEFHADAAPHQKNDTLDQSNFRSLLSSLQVELSTLLISAIPTACKASRKICKEKNVDFLGDTDEALGTFVAWSFTAMYNGVHPTKDWNNEKFTDSYRKTMAGKPLDPVHKRRFIIWVAPADNDHNANHYHLPHFSSNEPCMACPCNTTDTPWRDMSENAAWRRCCYSAEDKFTVFQHHWLMTIPGFTPATFGYDPMHCQEMGPSATAIANVFFDLTKKEFTGKKSERMNKLNREIQEAYRELGTQGNKAPLLDYKHFCDNDAPFKNQPDLMHSVIKARQTRYLVPVAAKLCRKYHKRNAYSTARLKCLESLSESYDIVDKHNLFLCEDTEKYQQCIHDFVTSYHKLNGIAVSKDEKQWVIRPKLHYTAHIGLDACWMSPKATWAYRGESMVGSVSSLAASCLHSTPPYRVPAAVCSKYRLAKHLQFKFSL